MRTNVALTGNVQMIVDAADNVKFAPLSNSSSTLELESDKSSYAKQACKLWSTLRLGAANIFNVVNSDSIKLDSITIDKQFDVQYLYGCKHTERANVFRYFAPLFITQSSMPKWFVLMRCDDTQSVSLQQLVKTGTLIKRWKMSDIVELQSHIESLQYAPMFVSQSTEQRSRLFGFDINTGQSVEQAFDLPDTELSNYDFDAYLVGQFQANNIACSHIVNLSFEFEEQTDNAGAHRYVGFYCDADVEEELTASSRLVNFPMYEHYDACVALLEYVDGEIVKLRRSMPIDYSRLYTEKLIAHFNDENGLKPNIYTSKRSIDLTFTGKMRAGEGFRIVAEGELEVEVYCITKQHAGQVDSDNWFIEKHDMQSTIDAFIAAFNNSAASAMFAYTCKQTGTNTIHIESNSTSIGSLQALLPYSMAVGNTAWKSSASFDLPITTANSLLIDSSRVAYLLQASHLVIYRNDGTSVKIKVSRTELVPNNPQYTIIVFDHNLDFDATDVIAFDMMAIKAAVVSVCKLYDMFDLAGFYAQELPYTTNTEFNVDAWHVMMLQKVEQLESEADKVLYHEVIARQYEYLQQATKSLTAHAIKSYDSDLNETITSDSIYDRHDELTAIAQLNKPNIKVHHWQSVVGSDALNKPQRVNSSITFNYSGFSPYEQLSSYILDAFQYSWFAEGFQMPDYIASIADKRIRNLTAKSYAVSSILSDTAPDYDAALLHKFADAESYFAGVPVWTVVSKLPGNSVYGYAMFKGVQYLLNANFVGFRFAVVHTDSDTIFELEPKLMPDYKNKTVTLFIPYKIVDSAVTSFDGLLADKIVDKSLLYAGNKPVMTVSDSSTAVYSAESSKAYSSYISMPITVTVADASFSNWQFMGQRKSTWWHQEGSAIYWAASMKADASFGTLLSNVIKPGDSMLFIKRFTYADQVYEQVVQLTGLTSITNEQFWFTNAICQTIVNGVQTELYSIVPDLYDGVSEGKDNPAIFSGYVPRASILKSVVDSVQPQLAPTIVMTPHRFNLLSFFKQFDAINKLTDIKACAHYAKQCSVLSTNASTMLDTAIIRYGLYCMPELTQASTALSVDDNAGKLHASIIAPEQFDVDMFARTLYQADIVQYRKLSCMQTWQDTVFTDALNMLQSCPTFTPLCMSAGHALVFANKSVDVTLQISNAMQTIDISSVIRQAIGDTASRYSTWLQYLQETLTSWQLNFVDLDGNTVSPIYLDKTDKQHINVQFDMMQTPVIARFTF